MGRKARLFKKADILKAINGSNGNMSVIAGRLKCEWHTAKINVERFPETKIAFNDEHERLGDFVESKGFELVKKGDGNMIRYYLSTKFRNRGYDLNEPPEKEVQESVDKIEIVDFVETDEVSIE